MVCQAHHIPPEQWKMVRIRIIKIIRINSCLFQWQRLPFLDLTSKEGPSVM